MDLQILLEYYYQLNMDSHYINTKDNQGQTASMYAVKKTAVKKDCVETVGVLINNTNFQFELNMLTIASGNVIKLLFEYASAHY